MPSRLEKLKPWLLPGAIFAAGALLRIWSLWRSDFDIDESWRAMVISAGPEGRGSVPTVPPLTLVVPRLSIALFGNSEATLRLPGFLLALGSLWLTYLLTRRIAGRTAAALAMFFLAFQPEYVHYDTILKQYPYEVFLGLALLYLAERVISRGSVLDRILFAVTAVAGVFLATSLVHYYPAVFCLLLWSEWKRAKRFPFYSVTVGAAALAVSIADYLMFLKPVNTSGLTTYWGQGFVSEGSFLGALSRLAGMTFEMFRQFLYHPSGILGHTFYRPIAWLFLGLTVVGCVRLLKERRPRLVVYAGSTLSILAAYSLIRLWPFGASRVNLFFFPLLMILAAVGAAFVWERLRSLRGAGPVAAGLLAAALLAIYIPVLRAREFYVGIDQIRTPIGRLLEHYQPGDAVLTRDTTHQIFLYYSLHYGPFRGFRQDFEVFSVYHPWVINMLRRPIPQDEIFAEVERHFRTHRRIWIVFKWDMGAPQEESAILRAARLYGRQRWASQQGFYKVLLFLPRRDDGSAAADALPEPQDP